MQFIYSQGLCASTSASDSKCVTLQYQQGINFLKIWNTQEIRSIVDRYDSSYKSAIGFKILYISSAFWAFFPQSLNSFLLQILFQSEMSIMLMYNLQEITSHSVLISCYNMSETKLGTFIPQVCRVFCRIQCLVSSSYCLVVETKQSAL